MLRKQLKLDSDLQSVLELFHLNSSIALILDYDRGKFYATNLLIPNIM